MKTLLIFLFLVTGIFFITYAQGLEEGEEPDPEYMLEQDPTYSNLPLPSEILVVYNANVEYSEIAANYYQQARNIPSINLCPITDLPLSENYGAEGGAYLVNWYRDANNFYNYPAQDGEVIISWVSGAASGKAHWLYYKDYIETPIKDYMDENNLTDDIRYIVLMKGLPYRLIRDPSPSYSVRVSASVCALLSLMNQPDERDILTLYNTPYYHSLGYYTNPYLGVDYPPTMDYRFKSGHFENAGGWYLNYLVSRLDGDTYEDVIDLIDRITLTDKSGNKKWILDDKPRDNNPNQMKFSTMPLAADRLDELGFNYRYDNLIPNVTSDNDEVIGYSSHGYYAFWDSSYIWTQLQFDYVNGALFNSWESKNGLSYGKWHSDHGHLSDFIVMGGSGGGANANEPLEPGVFREGDSYPAYAMGYSIVDAIYQGINYIAWQNDVIGDPLQTIAWGKQKLTDDLTWEETNLVTGEIDITNHIITIENSSVINLRHQGFITGDGKLMIGNNVTFNIYSWQKGLFLSYDSNNPRLVWGEHPTFGSSANYNIYRKIDTSAWSLIAQTTSLEYTDTEMLINIPGDLAPNLFYKILASSEMPGYDTSNTVQASAEKGKNKIAGNSDMAQLSYSLEQNYPNPFNPSTVIHYSVKDAGLVSLKVFDILGRELALLVNDIKETGYHSVEFNASDLPSGVYIYTLQVNGYTDSKKMLLLK